MLPGTSPTKITEIQSVKNSFFKAHEVIWIFVTWHIPARITDIFRPLNFQFSGTFRDDSVVVDEGRTVEAIQTIDQGQELK